MSGFSTIQQTLDSLELRAGYNSHALLLSLPKKASLQSLRSKLEKKQYFTEITHPPKRLRDKNHWSLIAPVEQRVHPTLKRIITKKEQRSIY